MNVKGLITHGMLVSVHAGTHLPPGSVRQLHHGLSNTSKPNFWIWKHTSKCLLCWDWAGHCSPGTLLHWHRKHPCSSGPGTSPSDSVDTWSYSHCWSWHRRRTWAPHTWSGHNGYETVYTSRLETPSGDHRGAAVWCPVQIRGEDYICTHALITTHKPHTHKPHTHTNHEKSTLLKNYADE